MEMYLRLFHGRDSLDQEMEDWGFNGPVIGPLRFCHTAYFSTICIRFMKEEDKRKFFGVDPQASRGFDCEVFLDIEGDCIKYQDKFYGDWSCFIRE